MDSLRIPKGWTYKLIVDSLGNPIGRGLPILFCILSEVMGDRGDLPIPHVFFKTSWGVLLQHPWGFSLISIDLDSIFIDLYPFGIDFH